MCVIRNTSDMEEIFTYELAPQPPSLFHDGIMRKTQKSALGNILKNYVAHLPLFLIIVYSFSTEGIYYTLLFGVHHQHMETSASLTFHIYSRIMAQGLLLSLMVMVVKIQKKLLNRDAEPNTTCPVIFYLMTTHQQLIHNHHSYQISITKLALYKI